MVSLVLPFNSFPSTRITDAILRLRLAFCPPSTRPSTSCHHRSHRPRPPRPVVRSQTEAVLTFSLDPPRAVRHVLARLRDAGPDPFLRTGWCISKSTHSSSSAYDLQPALRLPNSSRPAAAHCRHCRHATCSVPLSSHPDLARVRKLQVRSFEFAEILFGSIVYIHYHLALHAVLEPLRVFPLELVSSFSTRRVNRCLPWIVICRPDILGKILAFDTNLVSEPRLFPEHVNTFV